MDSLRLPLVVLMAVAFITGCASSTGPAPVESRKVPGSATASIKRAGGTTAAPASAPPTSSASVPDGFYRIKRGDTLIGISLDHGVAWRDLATWNQIDNPNLIEVDQLIRIKPPAIPPMASSARSTGVSETRSGSADQRPMEVRSISPAAPTPSTSPQAATSGGTGPLASAPLSPPPSAPAAGAHSGTSSAMSSPAKPVTPEVISLSWPSKGSVITQFSDPGYKGIAISGAEGDPVIAAGDGRVVYSGSGLRGYGNLVIVKHEGDFLTAYAHNRSILVAEGQTVKRGQKIAELGKTDSDIPKLHFEVRRAGKPVDPMKYLAQR